MNTIDTPRTNDQVGYAGSTMEFVRIDFARTLERENARLSALNRELVEALENAVKAHAFDAAWKPKARAVLAKAKGQQRNSKSRYRMGGGGLDQTRSLSLETRPLI